MSIQLTCVHLRRACVRSPPPSQGGMWRCCGRPEKEAEGCAVGKHVPTVHGCRNDNSVPREEDARRDEAETEPGAVR